MESKGDDSETRNSPVSLSLQTLHNVLGSNAALAEEEKFSKFDRARLKVCLKENLLIILIAVSVIIGVILGFALRTLWSYEDIRNIWYLEFPGRLLLNMLKLVMLPLIISSLVSGMADIGRNTTGKLGLGALGYYMTTTFSAVILGIVLVSLIKPGMPDDLTKLERAGKSRDARPLDSLLDLVSQCFPDNIVTACFQRKLTMIGSKQFKRFNETSSTSYTVKVDKPYLKTSSGPNVLGVVVVSIVVGAIIGQMGDSGLPLKQLFNSINDLIFIVVDIGIWYTPVGLLFLVAGKFIATKDLNTVWNNLGMYMGTVLFGLFIHGFIVLPAIYFVCTRNSPLRFAINQMKSILTAWGTASSSATLPITMTCLIEKNKINTNIVRFVAPIGATINMDGTALYEAVASIFIAQINDMDLDIADVIVISLTATAAAIGAAGIPQAGLVTMVIVLTSVGLPTEDLTLILAVDWFLDRFRTSLNVWGDAVGAGILHHYLHTLFEGNEEPNADEVNDKEEKDVEVKELADVVVNAEPDTKSLDQLDSRVDSPQYLTMS